jgi:mono/diheme cytochrome c family protein
MVQGGEAEDVGKARYLKYCASCHGPGGKGDGVASGLFTKKPIDLTQIAKKNGGEFPTMQMINIVNGKQTLRAHGDPDMPVWGEVLGRQETDSMGSKEEVELKILSIVNYIKTLQKK